MKKAFLLNLFCWLSIVCEAQNTKFELGGTLGINSSKIQQYAWQRTDIPLQNPDWLLGKQFGLILRYRFTPTWAIRMNIQTIQKGWKGQKDAYGLIDDIGMTPQQVQDFQTVYFQRVSTRQTNQLVYVTVPVWVEYSFWNQRMYAQFGGYWGTLTDSPFSLFRKTQDWGASLGLGFRQSVSKRGLLDIGTTYYHGFSKIYDTLGSNNYYLPEAAKGNRTIAINVGFIFTNGQ